MSLLQRRSSYQARRFLAARVFQFAPRLEELEPRLPPGAAVEWLLLPALAAALPQETLNATEPPLNLAATVAAPVRSRLSGWLPAQREQEDQVFANQAEAAARASAARTGGNLFGNFTGTLTTSTTLGLTLPDSLDTLPAVVGSAVGGPIQPVPAVHGLSGSMSAATGDFTASAPTPPAPPNVPAEDLGLTRTAGQLIPVANQGGGIQSGPATDQDLVPVGSEWRYLDDGSRQGTAWRGLAYNDSSWASGPAQLGYGDGDEATVISYGPDPNNKYITTYFRHSFTVDDPSVFQSLQIWLLRDDGAAVYLNGSEIFRSNLPTGTLNYLTLASTAIGGDDESAWHHSAIPAAALRPGTNVLAVEVHQAAVTSSDISFDFDLTGSVAVRFAVVGDYGMNNAAERAVADMIKSWYVDFVVTTGDNNYPNGEASTIVQNIGQYYCPFIRNTDASAAQRCNAGLSTNRFWPTPGNHDWDSVSPLTPYLNYFTLPTGSGNERYYEFRWGNVQLFMVDSDPREPNGRTSNSAQGSWFQTRLAASTAPWKVVAMHHPPYSSGDHGSTTEMQWPYQQWGASAVFAGHDHSYERIIRDGFPYFVNGLGGATRYGFGPPIEGSEARYNANYGAMFVQAGVDYLYFAFLNLDYSYFDEYTIV